MGMTWGIIPGPQNEETHSQTPGFLVFPGGEAIRKKTWKVTMQYLLVVSTPLKNMKVTWDDDMIIPNIWKNNGKKKFQTTNQNNNDGKVWGQSWPCEGLHRLHQAG